jgi:hypothetical protein
VPDLQALLKDRRFQIAAGGGAVIGAVVLLRKGKGGGETSSTTGTAGSLGTFSDSGMGAYNNLNDELNAGIAAYADELTTIEDQLKKLQTTKPGTPAPAPKPKPKPVAKPGPWGWFISRNNKNTPKAIASKYGISESELFKLNPGLKGKKTVKIGTRVKVRSGAGPYAPKKK